MHIAFVCWDLLLEQNRAAWVAQSFLKLDKQTLEVSRKNRLMREFALSPHVPAVLW